MTYAQPRSLLDSGSTRKAEQNFQDEMKTLYRIAKAISSVACYLVAERLAVRSSYRAYYAGEIREHFGIRNTVVDCFTAPV